MSIARLPSGGTIPNGTLDQPRERERSGNIAAVPIELSRALGARELEELSSRRSRRAAHPDRHRHVAAVGGAPRLAASGAP